MSSDVGVEDPSGVQPGASQEGGFKFLTAVNLRPEDDPATRRRSILDSVKGGTKILDLYGDLNELVRTLDDRVEKLLEDHENDFFLAYKTHMYSVQKEFKALKQKADIEEAKTRRDTRIKSLEKELEWFMTEALRLDELCKSYKRDVDKWKAKAEALEEDRRFLEDQIKGSKRQNKVLKAAVERAQNNAYHALVLSQTSPPAPALTGGADTHQPPASLPAVSTRPREDTQDRGASAPSMSTKLVGPVVHETIDEGRGATYVGEDGIGMGMGMGMGAAGEELEGRYVEQINKLKAQVEKQKKTIRTLRTSASHAYGERSELEEFFLKCIDEVRREISRRRHRARQYHTQLLQKSIDSSTSKEGAAADTDKSPRPEEAGSIPLDSFTTADRRKAIELLLSSETVLVHLYEKMFPHRASGVPMGATKDRSGRDGVYKVRSSNSGSPKAAGGLHNTTKSSSDPPWTSPSEFLPPIVADSEPPASSQNNGIGV